MSALMGSSLLLRRSGSSLHSRMPLLIQSSLTLCDVCIMFLRTVGLVSLRALQVCPSAAYIDCLTSTQVIKH
jgi:hypothetical protein